MEKIINSLQHLGIRKNDAKVYVALLQLGRSNPSKISKKTNIVRARVYDSLKRLEKKGYVEREAVKRAPIYSAISPNLVFSSIEKDLSNKFDVTQKTEKLLQKYVHKVESKDVWAVKGIEKIKSNIREIFSQTKDEIMAIITPDYTFDSEGWIFNVILSNIKPSIKVSVGMKVGIDNIFDVKKLLDKGMEVYHWSITEEIPIGLYTSDRKRTLITTIGNWEKIPQHDIGLLIRGDMSQHKGFEFLIQWFFSSCKKAEEQIKILEGKKNAR